ncbi:putative virulence factor [Orrella marina]|uniref:Virulence factor n=1 Tax=Orrella marina TaxID=2163011 RepID=A0A2R4XMB4_9BURK|nr:virulence factor SrfC family protein [Orrella marina]AWB34942.1 hypothetical protein DBV39_15765 [Orrella marina]
MEQDELADRLSESWHSVYEQSGRAIEWIGRTRRSARRLDGEADHLVLKLRRARNQARSLQQVSRSASTVGFFGLSQAGKSYLISALAAGESGKLETVLDGQRLDFVEHINPPGGGKEATGLVTRFTRTHHALISGFPLRLRLFSEVELVKIFVNSFFNDFNLEKIGFSFAGEQAEAAHQALNAMQIRARSERVAGVTEEDVVDLWDYLKERFPWTVASLEGDFLPRLVDLAPCLDPSDRAQLFAFLWGRIQGFTDLFLRLSGRLSALGYPQSVQAPLNALVEPASSGEGFVQRDSIMNVDMLERLGRSDDAPIDVLVLDDEAGGADGNGAVHSIARAELAALTAELTICLANAPVQSTFESVDLLDFPGYRGRLKHESLDHLETIAAQDGRSNPVAQLFLRGKVAYLFERYTDLQEMNVLVVCTASHKQSDVADVGPVLSGWIRRTQGELACQRANRPSGLIWAITMFDLKIADSLNKSEAMMEMVWEDLVKMTMLERFAQYDWMQEWSPDQPFDTTFLVRKPRMPVTFLTLDNGVEQRVNPASADALALMERTFCADALVNEHVAQPEQAWRSMLSLNDGGISRLSDYISRVAIRQHKLTRLAEQLERSLQDLVEGRLGPWFYHQGADEVQARKRIAQNVVDAIVPRARLLGELQTSLLLSDEVLQSLYMRSGLDSPAAKQDTDRPHEDGGSGSSPVDDGLGLGMGLDLFGDTSAGPAVEPVSPAVSGSDARFARAVVREWINHLRGIPENTRLASYLGLSRRTLEQIADELITGIARHDLESRLLVKVSRTEQVGTKRERLADRQALAVKAVLGDFVAWLGFDHTDPANTLPSRINPGHSVFARPDRIASGELPPVTDTAVDYGRIYLADWLVALGALIVGNAGHDAGREISAQLNAELGDILKSLKSARVEVA